MCWNITTAVQNPNDTDTVWQNSVKNDMRHMGKAVQPSFYSISFFANVRIPGQSIKILL
jgi:hypothetical protein